MKLHGDVSDDDKELAIKLIAYEKQLDSEEDFPAEKKAQSFVCLAHDWYELGMEEEGGRLLLRAQEVYPSYFKTKIEQHIRENKDFALLVRNMRVELMWMVINQVKDKK